VIDGYIPPRVQIIAANGLLFVSTAKGLYTLDAGNGSLKWLYPTEMPLGNSPTIANGVAYVGGKEQ
jgi:outer membrane protein assembly factor BamB